MLDAAAGAALFEQALAGITPDNTSQAPQALAGAFHTYAKQGTLLGGNLAAGGTEALLVQAFASPTTPAAMAQAICDFWATCITPGLPAHGGTAVVSVAINAQAVVPAMTQAIQGCVTDAEQAEPYKILIQAIEDTVKTVPCIVTELVATPSGPVPTAFPEFIT